MNKKFELGMIVATASVASLKNENSEFERFVNDSLEKFTNCDWGNVCDDDKEQNNDSLTCKGMLLGSYEKEGFPKIWIITDYGHTVTTILQPCEY